MEKEKIKYSKSVGGFANNKDGQKKAKDAKLKALGRKPRTAKEHEQWRKKQRKSFVLWRSFLNEE